MCFKLHEYKNFVIRTLLPNTRNSSSGLFFQLVHCSVLKYEFCIRYSLSMGLTCTMLGRRLSDCGGWCGACMSRFWSDSVSDPPSSSCSKLVLSSNEISELQKLSPECVGYVSANKWISYEYYILLFIEVYLFLDKYFSSSMYLQFIDNMFNRHYWQLPSSENMTWTVEILT